MQFHGGFNIGGFSQGLFSGMNEMQKIQSAYYDIEAKAQAAATGKAAEAAKNQQAIQTSDATKNAADQAAAAAAGAKGPPSMQQPGEATAPLAQVAGPVSATPATPATGRPASFSRADLDGLTMQPKHLAPAAPAQALPLPPPDPGAAPPQITPATQPTTMIFTQQGGNGTSPAPAPAPAPTANAPYVPEPVTGSTPLWKPLWGAITHPSMSTPMFGTSGRPASQQAIPAGSAGGPSRSLLAPARTPPISPAVTAHTFNGVYHPMGMQPPIGAPQQAIPTSPASPAGAPQISPATATSNPLGLGGGSSAVLPSLANGQQNPMAGIYNNYNPGP